MVIAAIAGRGLGVNLRDYILFWPGVAATIFIALLVSGRVARMLDRSWATAFALVFSVGLIAAATLTPGRDALLFGVPGSGSCEVTQVGVPSLRELLSVNETSLNVLLFVPLGIVIGSLVRSRLAMVLLVAAVALPFAIEAVQLVITPLGRTCQAVDVVDNLTGLFVGLGVGILGAAVTRLVRGPRPLAEDRVEPDPDGSGTAR